MCDPGVGHTYWSRSQEHHARCKKRTLNATLDLPLFGNLAVGNWSSTPGEGLGFEQAPCVLVRLDEGKQAKACVILPGLGLSPAQLH